jgi:hypothetical protein
MRVLTHSVYFKRSDFSLIDSELTVMFAISRSINYQFAGTENIVMMNKLMSGGYFRFDFC